MCYDVSLLSDRFGVTEKNNFRCCFGTHFKSEEINSTNVLKGISGKV